MRARCPLALHVPLPLLLGTVVIGVGLVVVLSRVLGGPPRAVLPDAAAVSAALAWEGAPPADAMRCAGGRVGLALLGEDVGVVGVLGDGLWTRRLGRGSLRSVVSRGEHLRIRVRDPALPPIDLPIPDPAARRRWAARLGALT